MGLTWGQGKIEVEKRRNEITALLRQRLPISWIIRQLNLPGHPATHYRAINALKAEQAEQPSAALPVPVPKSQPPKVSDQRSLTSSATPSVPSDGEGGMSKRAQFHLSSQRDPSELI